MHINIRVSKEEAISRLNKSYEISGYIMALVAASPFIDNCDSSYDDIRRFLWTNGYEDRKLSEFNIRDNRTTTPSAYYIDLQDYIRKLSTQTLLDNEQDGILYTCQKMNWKNCRLKFIDVDTFPKLLLEIRYLPIQSSRNRDILCTLFIIGCIFCDKDENISLLPISLVRENMRRACHFSLDETMFFREGKNIVEKSAREILEILLSRSVSYWKEVNIGIAERLDKKIQEYICKGNIAEEMRRIRYQEYYNDEQWIAAIIVKSKKLV